MSTLTKLFQKFLTHLKWFFSITKGSAIKFLTTAELSDEEFNLLKIAYDNQVKKRSFKKEKSS